MLTKRERVVCYITRKRQELLVLTRPDWTSPGVVAGGVDAGETREQAAVRETWEEAGLELSNPVYLGSFERHLTPEEFKFSPVQVWNQHYFWLEAPEHTPDAWSHEVSAGEDDKGLIHQLFFVSLEQHNLAHTIEAFLPQLEEYLWPTR